MDRRNFIKSSLAGGFALATGGGLVGLSAAHAGTGTGRHPRLASDSIEDVGLCLNIMYDTSLSVTDAAYRVEVEGIATALASEDFRNAIFMEGGPKSVAILITEFDTNSRVRIPWVDIREGEDYKLQRLAAEIATLERFTSRFTHQVKGLMFCADEIDRCPWSSERKALAFMTDGKENGDGFFEGNYVERVEAAIDHLAVNHDISVSSLAILHKWFPNLDEWCRKHFYTRPGYVDRNGRPLERGISMLVANSLDDQTDFYHNQITLALRSIIRMDIAQAPDPGVMRTVAEQYPARKDLVGMANPDLDWDEMRRLWVPSHLRPDPELQPVWQESSPRLAFG